MSCFISELLLPEDSGGLLWIDCQRCRRREECPFARDQALRRAARQRSKTARFLTTEADRLLETISCAEDARCLLNADEALERALSHALHVEMALLDDRCAQMT